MTTLPIDRKTLAMASLAICRGYVAAGIKEVGDNGGAQVTTFQQARGGETAESWCLDFQMTCDLKALANLLKRPYTPQTFVAVCAGLRATLALYHTVTGSCGAAKADAQARGLWIDRNALTEIEAGWLILYAWSGLDVANRVPRHVGRCDADWKRSNLPIVSLEGNTAPDGGDQSDGDGCYRKARSFANVVGVIKTY